MSARPISVASSAGSGYSRSGLPKAASEVRKVIGANMCFRREVLRRVGGFNQLLGPQCLKPVGCEEPELRISSKICAPGYGVREPVALAPRTRTPGGATRAVGATPEDWAVQDPISAFTPASDLRGPQPAHDLRWSRLRKAITCWTGKGRGGSAPSRFPRLDVGRMKT